MSLSPQSRNSAKRHPHPEVDDSKLDRLSGPKKKPRTSLDLRELTERWTRAGCQAVRARYITTDRKLTAIQLHTRRGLSQMQLDGRPDGERIGKCKTFLEHCQQVVECEGEEGHTKGGLAPDTVDSLVRELHQFEQRRLAYRVLNEPFKALRDVCHVVRIANFLGDVANDSGDARLAAQSRNLRARIDSVLGNDVRAVVQFAFKSGHMHTGLAVLHELSRELGKYHRTVWGNETTIGPQGVGFSEELKALKEKRDLLARHMPLSTKPRLDYELRKAVAEQNYERAAELKHLIQAHAEGALQRKAPSKRVKQRKGKGGRRPLPRRDLGRVLKNFKYEPGTITTRVIDGKDGRAKVQTRTDLGINQMELHGHPLGSRPQGSSSIVKRYERQLKEHLEATGGDEQSFALSPDECVDVRQEAQLYKLRAVSLLSLGLNELAIRDTNHVIRASEMLWYADHEADYASLDSERPFILVLRTQARARLHYEEGRYDLAVKTLEEGFLEIKQEPEIADYAVEHYRKILVKERDQVMEKLPADSPIKIQEALDQALAREDFRRATVLKEQLSEWKSKWRLPEDGLGTAPDA